jgi:hypothetical protein
MKIQTLTDLDNALGGRSKFKLRKKMVRLSFYLGIRETEHLKAYADNHETSISELVRDKLKPLLKQLKA